MFINDWVTPARAAASGARALIPFTEKDGEDVQDSDQALTEEPLRYTGKG